MQIIEEEIKLNINKQYEPSMENIDLFIDFLYGGCWDEVFEDLIKSHGIIE